MINIQINTSQNFWVVNPQAKIVFEDVYEDDDSKDKEESSTYMWALTLMYHPESILAEFLPSEQLTYVRESFLKDKDWTPDNEFDTSEKYKRVVLTSKQRILSIWRDKFDERNRYMSELSYFEGDGDILEKMLEKTNKVWTEYLRAEQDVEKEKEETTRGGAVESATDSGKL